MSLSLARQAAHVRHGPRTLLRRSSAQTRSTLRLPGSIHYANNNSLKTLTCLSRYSTAAPAPAPVEQTRLDHIILPNPALHQFKKTARVLPSTIAEQFAILNACIRTGSMERAERIMHELYRTKPEEMKVFVDVQMYNTYLNGFIESPTPMTQQCLAWFDAMRNYGITPDVNTYAIIVKGFLKMKSYHTSRALLQEMQSNGDMSIQDMIKSNFLSEQDVAMFRDLILENQGSSSEAVQKLLLDLECATDDILGKPEVPLRRETKNIDIHIEEVPEAIPTKSIGVKFLQEQLAALRDPRKALQVDPYELQRELEHQGYEVAMQRLLYDREASMERGDTLNAMNLTPLKKIMWDWHEKMIPLLQAEISRCDKITRETDRNSYAPFLKLLPPEKLAIITILELLRLHNSSGIADGMKTARAVIDVGKAVEMEYNATQMKKASHKLLARNQEVHSLFASGKLFNMAVRKAHMKLTREQESMRDLVESSEGDTGVAVGSGDWTPVWPSTIRAKVGSVLTSLLIDAAKIPVPSRNPETGEKIIENIPAFFHTYQYVRGKRVGIVKFSEPLTDLLSREPVRDTLHPRMLPMIVHPRPWLSYNSGGYLSAKSTCMRIKDSPEQLIYLHKASEQDRFTDVLAGLDVLGSTRWRVNKKVFNVVLEAWNTGEPIADIPPAINEPTPLPAKPENYDTDPKAKFQWVNRVKEIQTRDKNFHSLRCDVNYKVETARAFLNIPMYFPHNMDFRGRAYPIPPTLNHLGNDLCRGLLHFDEAKPLGQRGWRWLKIHLANLYGYDKHSFSERENFTVENMDNILDSVQNPLSGKKWWLKAESPWQCLAACYEVAAAYESGKPEEYPSQLPIHQDGTCNGLQHYAALGGDLAGARAVNLAPSDKPADVYTGVADMVNKQIEQDAAAGDELAQLLQGKVSRKVVKQTVMTNVYGVTFIGARAQIESRLKERGDIPPEKIYVLAGYLAKKVFSSLGEMFNGARQIQDWLTDSARRIARSVPLEALQAAGAIPNDANSTETEAAGESKLASGRGKQKKKGKSFSARSPTANQMSSVIWTTPLGLPIVQPYRRSGKKQVSTLLQTVFIEDPDASRPVNAMKQSTAFPPNFIHSLDATHMLMSAVSCHEKGMTFASVHDSYWTHACDVDEMNKVIRDQFIELHSQPIMDNLRKEFMERYKDYRIPVSMEMESKRKSKSKTAKKDTEQDLGFAASDMDAELSKSSTPRSEDQAAMDALFGLSDDVDVEEEAIEADEEEEPVKKKTNLRKYVHTWEELTFLPLPPKGEFDINIVKDSDYFFH
ncbi:DNA-directed RNA polymerase [Apophysomyces ossiformis]|uniref:DNA-directed RNA polymerase n=1 Tax=Apophysomyces ossiformis TaxID=679940 RepID=A0A8H7BMI0_9FUNG|nr:DNA-directed RNA polymerase [Apophysomyces ossiformis]